MFMEEHYIPNIKRARFDFQLPTSKARNQKEDLIEQIVSHCRCRSEKEKTSLAKRIAIWANTTKATTTDLHALLQKHRDPKVRNYGGLVNFFIKIKTSMD